MASNGPSVDDPAPSCCCCNHRDDFCFFDAGRLSCSRVITCCRCGSGRMMQARTSSGLFIVLPMFCCAAVVHIRCNSPFRVICRCPALAGTIALGSFAMSFFWLPSRIFIASESFVAFGKFTESFVCSMKSCTSRMPSLMPRQYWRGDLLLGRFELFHRVRDLPRYASLQVRALFVDVKPSRSFLMSARRDAATRRLLRMFFVASFSASVIVSHTSFSR